MSTSASSNGEFTIRVTGAAPPPLPSAAKKGKRGGGGRGKAAKNNAVQQQQRRYNMRLRPSSSVDQLRKDVFALFNVPSGSTKAYQMSFLGGFPPKELNPEGKHTIHELGIRPNESLIVKFSLPTNVIEAENGDTKQPAAAAESNLKEPPETALSNTGRPKRAAAKAATASFADVIAAQDALMKKDKKSPKQKKSAASSSNISGFGNASGKRIVTSGAATKKSPKKAKMEGAGYRLSDGKSFAGSSPSKRNIDQQRKKQQTMVKGEDDVANKLLSSLGGGGDKVGKFLRSAMKGAVTKSYEASRAAVRVTAVNTGEYSFEKVKGGSKVDGGVVSGLAKDYEPENNDANETSEANELLRRTLYNVSYSKGMEGRGRYEEQAEIIGLAATKAVLESIYDASNDPDEPEGGENKDGRLRPVMIAQLSPRIFWSLAYHCSEAARTDGNIALLSVEDMLRSTLPELDWAHLDRGGRKRVLSEKARENLRQKTEPTAQPTSTTSSQSNEDERAQQAIDDLAESALDGAAKGDDDQESNERERRAKAAMARFGNANDKKPSPAPSPASQKSDIAVDDWTLVTPMEDDIDELIECIMAGTSPEGGEDSTIENYGEDAAKSWAGILLDSVRNWRVLANSDVDHIISNLTDRDCPMPSNDTIEKWIDAAQGQALEEIMVEILGGDQDALDVLQHKANSSSPRDLIFWKSAPGILLNTICTEESSKKWEISDVKRWTRRAQTALDTCTWLELYTS